MRKGWVLLLVLALGAALAQVRSFEEIKRSGEIRIGTEGAFPPSTTLTSGTSSPGLRWTWATPSPSGSA
ncbi:hypothetical protein TthSNM11_15570 [Thermus thermophilus]|nr:hypothetical protein TthSNM11_15570 [Thermus thermophilus]